MLILYWEVILKKIFTLLFLLSAQNIFSATLTKKDLYKAVSVWRSSTGEKFKLCRISSNGASELIKKKKIKVLFEEDKSNLSRKYKAKLRRFFKRLPKNTYQIRISAHADSCGNHDYNHQLSLKRGMNVYHFIKNLLPEGINIRGNNHGELESSGHSAHDKFVEIEVHYWKPFEKVTQVVLFDISGSLHRRKTGHTTTGLTLEDLKRFRLKKGSIAFVPRDIRYKCQGQNLSKYFPIGEDYYWEAMTLLSNSIRGNAVGVTFTDDTDPNGARKEHVFNRKNTGKIRWHIQ